MLKSNLKRLARMIAAYFEYIYDYYRFIKNNAWRLNFKNTDVRSYFVTKVYHSLEKSLSLKSRNSKSGMSNAILLADLLKNKSDKKSFQEKVAINVLSDFLKESSNEKKIEIENSIVELEKIKDIGGGVYEKRGGSIKLGKLESPEDFFMTRYTLRSFSNESIEDDLLQRAIKLAMKSPSACNRQAWHIYDIKEKKNIDKALSFQNGNRGFEREINRLLIICGDLNAFVSHKERYQHWIDGGMFAMSLIWTLHSLGLASCCLNWSQGMKNDLGLRREINIKDNHSIIMMLAIGYPDEEAKLCYSARRPLEEIYTQI